MKIYWIEPIRPLIYSVINSTEKGLREICAQAGFKQNPMTVSEEDDPCSIWPEIRYRVSADVWQPFLSE